MDCHRRCASLARILASTIFQLSNSSLILDSEQTGGELFVHLRFEIVFHVFCFPVAAWEVEGVHYGRVHAQGALAGAGNLIFADDEPVEWARALFQE
jgi:hypothetical protein